MQGPQQGDQAPHRGGAHSAEGVEPAASQGDEPSGSGRLDDGKMHRADSSKGAPRKPVTSLQRLAADAQAQKVGNILEQAVMQRPRARATR